MCIGCRFDNSYAQGTAQGWATNSDATSYANMKCPAGYNPWLTADGNVKELRVATGSGDEIENEKRPSATSCAQDCVTAYCVGFEFNSNTNQCRTLHAFSTEGDTATPGTLSCIRGQVYADDTCPDGYLPYINDQGNVRDILNSEQ